jgi:2-methylcitrate dehydratase PrpD
MTLSETLSHYVYNLTLTETDQDTVEAVKSRIIDYIAVAAAATYYSDIPKRLIKYADAISPGYDTGVGHKDYPENIAGFLNGAFAHCLDYDDGHLWAGIHAAGPVIGTAFALAPKYRPNGKLFVAAIIAGYEVEYRLGKALGKSHIQKGYHGSCTCGVIGAAATAGKLIGLTERQLTYAMGLAGLAVSGYRQPLIEGQMAKPVQVGYAAERGITAALLANQNIEAPLQIFEGDKGLFQILSDLPTQQIVNDCLADLGARPLIHDTYTKLFPCCRYTHAAIEASFYLRKSISNLEDISEIIVNTFDIAIDATAPNQSPNSPQEARFSMNYLLAVALHTGSVGVDDFTDEAIRRRDIRATAKKVKAYSTNYWNEVYPDVRGAEMIIKLRDGSTYTRTIDKLSGISGDPEEVKVKFVNSCKKVYSQVHMSKILDCVSGIVDSKDASALVRLWKTEKCLSSNRNSQMPK